MCEVRCGQQKLLRVIASRSRTGDKRARALPGRERSAAECGHRGSRESRQRATASADHLGLRPGPHLGALFFQRVENKPQGRRAASGAATAPLGDLSPLSERLGASLALAVCLPGWFSGPRGAQTADSTRWPTVGLRRAWRRSGSIADRAGVIAQKRVQNNASIIRIIII